MIRAIDRKAFIRMTTWGAASLLISSSGFLSSDIKIKAVAFDAFPIFDPGSIFKPVNELMPAQAKQLIELWQARQFSYQWLRGLADKYKNFLDIARDALDFALTQSKLNPSTKERELIMGGYDNMNIWSDVIPALQAINKEGLRISFLSNMTAKMLHRGIQNSNLTDLFDLVISTDEKRIFKPSAEAYQMAVEQLKLKKQEILFVPFAGWDLAGAKWFGYPTFWVNRSGSLLENLDAEPDGSGSTLNDLVEFIRRHNKN
jgi:2-haloacid dehalogenase